MAGPAAGRVPPACPGEGHRVPPPQARRVPGSRVRRNRQKRCLPGLGGSVPGLAFPAHRAVLAGCRRLPRAARLALTGARTGTGCEVGPAPRLLRAPAESRRGGARAARALRPESALRRGRKSAAAVGARRAPSRTIRSRRTPRRPRIGSAPRAASTRILPRKTRRPGSGPRHRMAVGAGTMTRRVAWPRPSGRGRWTHVHWPRPDVQRRRRDEERSWPHVDRVGIAVDRIRIDVGAAAHVDALGVHPVRRDDRAGAQRQGAHCDRKPGCAAFHLRSPPSMHRENDNALACPPVHPMLQTDALLCIRM